MIAIMRLGKLISGMTHEMNTPLSAIRYCAGNISNLLTKTLKYLPQIFKSLSPEEWEDFSTLLN